MRIHDFLNINISLIRIMAKACKAKIIYVSVWTVVMCYVSFHAIFEKGLDSVLNIQSTPSLAENYIFPFFTAVGLYLIDGIYNGLLLFRQDRPLHSIAIMVSMLCFFIGFLFSVYSSCIGVKLAMFIFAWIALGGLKFYETPTLSLDGIEANNGSEVSED